MAHSISPQSRELTRFTKLSPADEFLEAAAKGNLARSTWLLSDPSLLPEHIGIGLIQACRNGKVENVLTILNEDCAGEISSTHLGYALEALMHPANGGDSNRYIEILTKMRSLQAFQEVHAPFIGNAFIHAVEGNEVLSVGFFLEFLQIDLTPDTLLSGMKICVKKNYNFLLKVILQSPLVTPFPLERRDALKQMYFEAVDLGHLKSMDAFAETPSFRAIIPECLGDMVLNLAKKGTVETLSQFLHSHWAVPIVEGYMLFALVETAQVKTFAHFKVLIMDQRSNGIYERGQIGFHLQPERARLVLRMMTVYPVEDPVCRSRMLGVICISLLASDVFNIAEENIQYIHGRDWYFALNWALDQGQSAHAVALALKHPKILEGMEVEQKEKIFLLALQIYPKCPDSWALATALTMNGFRDEAIDEVIHLSAQYGLSSIFRMAAQTGRYQAYSAETVRRLFLFTSKRGHADVVQIILGGPHSKKIGEAEINEIFLTYFSEGDKVAKVVALFFKEELNDMISPDIMNRFALEMHAKPNSPLIAVAVQSSCFSKVDDPTLDTLFAPFLVLGNIALTDEEGGQKVAYFNRECRKILSRRNYYEWIVNTDRFSRYAHQKAVYVAAAGFGFTSAMQTIRQRGQIDADLEMRAMIQLCSQTSFFLFIKEGDGIRVQSLPIPFFIQEKLLQLQAYVTANILNNYERKRKWLFLACQFGSRDAVQCFLNSYPLGTFRQTDVQYAQRVCSLNSDLTVGGLFHQDICLIS